MNEKKLLKTLKNFVIRLIKRPRLWIALFVFVWISLISVPIILGELHGKIPDAIDMTARADGYTVSYDIGIASAIKMLIETELSIFGWIITSILTLGLFVLKVTPLCSKYFNHLDSQ